MKRFIEGTDRNQVMLLPESVEDYVGADNPVRIVEAFVEQLDLREMGFEGTDPLATGRPAYHPAVMLKIYIYGYLNRIQSSRRLEHEAQRNVGLRRDRDESALARTAAALAAKLAGPDYAPLLLPFITERLEIHEAGGGYRVEAKNLPTLDHLAEELRSDPKFARIIIGASPADKALHAKRVAETLGAPAQRQSLTRTQFEALTPEKRAAHVRDGAKISDG